MQSNDGEGGSRPHNLRDFNSFVVNHLQTIFEGENELSKNLSAAEKVAVQKSIRIWTAAAVSQ